MEKYLTRLKTNFINTNQIYNNSEVNNILNNEDIYEMFLRYLVLNYSAIIIVFNIKIVGLLYVKKIVNMQVNQL